MNKMKKTMMAAAVLFGTCVAPMAAFNALGQELTDANGNKVEQNTTESKSSGGGFYDIVFGSGIVGMLLWFALFGDGAMAIYFCIDSSILIKPSSMCWNAAVTMFDMADGFCWQTSIALTTSPSAIADVTPSMSFFGMSFSGLIRIDESMQK